MEVYYENEIGEMMTNAKTYAVVDLEMTGTNPDGSERLIQFSCVFIENGKIVNEFSTLINPLKPIPEEVQALTNITNQDVKKAPTFDDVAPTIYALLQQTVFVAHNIELDYRFLNAEFERIGFPSLNLEGIDTVQLAQVVLPTLASYKLSDLTKYLGLSHNHPHRADSDALATANLFLFLIKKIKTFPKSLLKSLLKLADSMLFETSDVFKAALEQDEKDIFDGYYEIKGLVLKKQVLATSHKQKVLFPQTKAAQEQLFGAFLEWRQDQVQMMLDINQQLTDEDKTLVIQAPTGMGKTLGYLLPGIYWAKNGHQLVVATKTTALLDQLTKDSLQLLKQIVPFSFTVEVLKGSGHYIDLDKFYHSLSMPLNDQTRLLQMRILVWLFESKTGDLDELKLTTYNHQLFKLIKHQGVTSLNPNSPFFAADFLRQREQRVKYADLILTNQAYLLSHAAELAQTAEGLIVDEAQHLSTAVLQQSQAQIDLDLIKIMADTLLVEMESRISYSFAQLVEQGFLTKHEYRVLLRNLQTIDYGVPYLREKLWEKFCKHKRAKDDFVEIELDGGKLLGFLKSNFAIFLKISKAYQEFLGQVNHYKQRFEAALEQKTLGYEATSLLTSWFNDCLKLIGALDNWKLLEFSQLENTDETLIWLKYAADNPKTHLRICFSQLSSGSMLKDILYSKFDHIVMCGAGFYTPKTAQYVKANLGLSDDCVFTSYHGTFAYQKQALAVLATDGPDLSNLKDKKIYHDYLIAALTDILTVNQCQTLILFNSLEDIKAVYSGLEQKGVTKKREILAQGVNGSPGKLKKRFMLSSNPSVLLGADSFWEGIDLPKDKLELLIITRLPFQPPDRLLNKIQAKRLQKAGHNSFAMLTLPKAVLQFSQGFGRLIRSQHDFGVMAVLDTRLINKRYASEFIKALPNDLPLVELPTGNMANEIKHKLQEFETFK